MDFHKDLVVSRISMLTNYIKDDFRTHDKSLGIEFLEVRFTIRFGHQSYCYIFINIQDSGLSTIVSTSQFTKITTKRVLRALRAKLRIKLIIKSLFLTFLNVVMFQSRVQSIHRFSSSINYSVHSFPSEQIIILDSIFHQHMYQYSSYKYFLLNFL